MKEKEDMSSGVISLEMIDSTCLPVSPMNRNNLIESNHLIYLSGSFITFVSPS